MDVRGRLVAVALALVAFHIILLLSGSWATWVGAGSSSARAIVDGEVWRSVTAVTLHADAGHVLANAAFGLLFATMLAKDLGDGVAVAGMLAAAAAANLLSAAIAAPVHTSIGASTAVFGAVGMLVGLAAAGRGSGRATGSSPWLALGSGAALLALLGTAARADVLGHALGFMTGVPLGALAGVLARRGWLPSGAAAASVATAAVVGAWWLALR